jgi:hypothetical protein
MKKRFEKAQLTKISIEFSAVNKFWNRYTKSKGYIDNRQRCNIIIKHAFSVACRKHTSLSLSEIGGVINKDHATVLHAGKNHDANIKYLANYERTYKEVERELLQTMYHQDDISSAEEIHTIKELRERLIMISQKLRYKILELNYLYKQESSLPIRMEEENTFLKKHNRELHERNKRLEKELARVKNLI